VRQSTAAQVEYIRDDEGGLTTRLAGFEIDCFSCDETAAAVVVDGVQILSSVVSSQIDVHHPYGGVVPELASRKHMEAIVPVVTEALAVSGMDSKQLDADAYAPSAHRP